MSYKQFFYLSTCISIYALVNSEAYNNRINVRHLTCYQITPNGFIVAKVSSTYYYVGGGYHN